MIAAWEWSRVILPSTLAWSAGVLAGQHQNAQRHFLASVEEA